MQAYIFRRWYVCKTYITISKSYFSPLFICCRLMVGTHLLKLAPTCNGVPKIVGSLTRTSWPEIWNRPWVNLCNDIVLVTHLRIFCATLFTNNNIKVVIQMHSHQFDPFWKCNNQIYFSYRGMSLATLYIMIGSIRLVVYSTLNKVVIDRYLSTF